MNRAPSFDDIFAVMSAASVGDAEARVAIPNEPDLEAIPTRFAIALNVLLDDLAFRAAETIRSEDRYRSMFEKSPQPMWMFDRETLRFVEVNDAAVRHYGDSRDEFATLTIAD